MEDQEHTHSPDMLVVWRTALVFSAPWLLAPVEKSVCWHWRSSKGGLFWMAAKESKHYKNFKKSLLVLHMRTSRLHRQFRLPVTIADRLFISLECICRLVGIKKDLGLKKRGVKHRMDGREPESPFPWVNWAGPAKKSNFYAHFQFKSISPIRWNPLKTFACINFFAYWRKKVKFS